MPRQTTLLIAFALAAFAIQLTVGPIRADEVRTIVDETPLDGAESVSIKAPFARVLLAGGEEGNLSATLAIQCTTGSESCQKRAEKISLHLETVGGVARVRLDGATRGTISGLRVDLRVVAPMTLPAEIDLGVGDVSVPSWQGNLEIDVGLGNVEIDLEETRTRRVELDTGLGRARLATRLDEVRGSGVVRSGLRWSQGQGTAVVEVDCGIGDIQVNLR